MIFPGIQRIFQRFLPTQYVYFRNVTIISGQKNYILTEIVIKKDYENF